MILEMKNIVKTYGKVVANDNVSISLNEKEILAIVGENGAGHDGAEHENERRESGPAHDGHEQLEGDELLAGEQTLQAGGHDHLVGRDAGLLECWAAHEA